MISTPLRIARTLKSVTPGPSNAPPKVERKATQDTECEGLSGRDPPRRRDWHLPRTPIMNPCSLTRSASTTTGPPPPGWDDIGRGLRGLQRRQLREKLAKFACRRACIYRVQEPLELLQIHDVVGEVLHEHFDRPLPDHLDIGRRNRIVLAHSRLRKHVGAPSRPNPLGGISVKNARERRRTPGSPKDRSIRRPSAPEAIEPGPKHTAGVPASFKKAASTQAVMPVTLGSTPLPGTRGEQPPSTRGESFCTSVAGPSQPLS